MIRKLLRGVLGFLVFLLFWYLATLGNKLGEIAPPYATFLGLIQLVEDGSLWQGIVASVFRVGWGFCLAAGVGIPLGVAYGWSQGIRETFNPVTQALRPISPIAWIPVATIGFGGVNWFGIEAQDYSAIFLIFLSSFFPIVTATTSAVRGIDRKYIRSAENFGVTGAELFRRVVVPAALPQILTGLRLALGISWVVIVAAEMLGVDSGLGWQINDARSNIRYDLIQATMVVIAVIGLALDSAMSRVEFAALARRGMSVR